MPIKVCKSHSVMARFCAWCEFASFVVMLLSVHRPQPQHQRRRHRQCVPPASARRLQLASAHIVRQRSHKLNSKPALVSYAIYIQRPKNEWWWVVPICSQQPFPPLADSIFWRHSELYRVFRSLGVINWFMICWFSYPSIDRFPWQG